MPGKCRPSLRAKTLENVMRSNLSTTDKECIKAVFERCEAEPVVRCKDCKHGRESEYAFAVDTKKPLCDCCYMWLPHQWHEYCSFGERRADDAD